MLRPNIKYPHATPHQAYDMPALCAAYSFPKVHAGAYRPVGILELGGGYDPADIIEAFKTWELPAPLLTDVSVLGAKNTPGGAADGEVVLDIEVSAGAYSYCTGTPARVRTYFCPNSDEGFIAGIEQAIADNCAVLSISWGGAERDWSAAGRAGVDAACLAALKKCCTVFAASGDNDSGDGDTGNNVDFPASSPHVVGCGGTTKTFTSETVWNNGPGEGTGGGFSSKFPVQAYQIGAPAGPGRMVPDVAGNADPDTGYNVYLNKGWQVIGGTSAVAPLYAGLVAAIKGARAAAGKSPIGDILSILYRHPAAFFDVTDGNNGQWRAKQGVDPCTGLGSPIGTALLKVLG